YAPDWSRVGHRGRAGGAGLDPVLRLRGGPLLAHFLRQEEVQGGADDGDGAELADLRPRRGHRRREDVGAELELQRQRQVAREDEPDGGEVGRPAADQGGDEPGTRDEDPQPDDEGARQLDGEPQPLYA